MGLGKRLRSLFDSRARGTIPEDESNLVQRLLDDFCEHRVRPEVRSKLWYTYRVEGCRVELIENRPFFLNPDKTTEMEIARFEYEPGLGWTLFWADRDLRWHEYEGFCGVTFEEALREVAEDPTGIFHG